MHSDSAAAAALPSEHSSEAPPRWKREVLEWTKTLVLTIALSLGLRVAVVEAFVVPTGSMLPTIEIGDRLLGSKFHYRLWKPKQGDVVVFRPPDAAQKMTANHVPRYVKRVIAVGGDRVSIKNGEVFVNEELMSEPYIAAPPRYRLSTVTVPEGHLFVLGDNRNESHDSHVWGFVEEDDLIARVFARFWPLNRIGSL